MSHTITITGLPNDDTDDVQFVVGGTCDGACVVWHECKRKRCAAMNPDYGDERVRHGLDHMHIPGIGWCIESSECGELYAYNLGLEVADWGRLGTFGLLLMWSGDEWDAVIHEPQLSGSETPPSA